MASDLHRPPFDRSPLTADAGARLLAGWGRTAPTRARVLAVDSVAQVQREVAAASADRSGPARGVLARGLGRSYGDAAQSGGGLLLDLAAVDQVALDVEAGTVTAGAGASFDSLLRRLLPQGWFLPVTPGTRQVTVGGAVAADVHGKNHHVDGTFGAHVRALDLVTAEGALRTLAPNDPSEDDRETFWCTVGGLGLTGVITQATFDVLPVTTSWMRVDTERAGDLDSLMARMVESDRDVRYSVAWVDAMATGARWGRGVLTRGDHAELDELPRHNRSRPLVFAPRDRLAAPAHLPGRLVNRATARSFNAAWFGRASVRREGELQSIAAFFHPLDGVRDWNRVYGRRGLLQYQFVVPDEAGQVVGTALRRLQRLGAPVAMTVLKRFGPANPAPLSFPRPGWTLAVDVPADVPGLARTLDQLDDLVAASGGRLYLAKDARMSPETFAHTYPGASRWQAVRRRLDPGGLFTSDLERRVMP
ncbi:MAG: FAD-binding protein [Actinomycetes bacterium]